MRLAEYRRAQDTITRRVVAAAVATLRALAGRPLAPAQWRLLLDALFPMITQGRGASHRLALDFYTAQRADHLGQTDTELPHVDPPAYDQPALDALLTRTARPRLTDPGTARVAVTTTAAAVARHVEQAGRDTLITATARDAVAVGWARVPTGERTCAFCWMLASRGPDYGTETSAGGKNDWHDGCNCAVVPVFDRDTWDGRDTFLAARRRWNTATDGYSGVDALNAFRRSLYANPITT
jgi:hypothetical protein